MFETHWDPASTTLSERLMRSCARHRLVAASSRSTDEKVASRSGSGRHCLRASRALALSLRLHLRVSRSPSGRARNIPEEASHHVLEEARRQRLDELGNHIAQHGADGVEALVRGANVVEPVVVEQDLLHNEDGHSLAKL